MTRAFALLIFVIGLSVAATWYFGEAVLIALGLIASQVVIVAKLLGKKLATLDLPVFIAWIKAQGAVFLRVELIKKYLTTVVMPMFMGRVLVRRLQGALRGWLATVAERHRQMMAWFNALPTGQKVVAWLIVLFATLALSVTSLGLWLVLFSVQLPLWLVAFAAGAAKSIWLGTQKWAFKALAFFQLAWLWRGLRRVLPERVLLRKRRLEFRIARAVIRRRRMTVRQLAERKDRLPFKLGIIIEYVFVPRRDAQDR